MIVNELKVGDTLISIETGAKYKIMVVGYVGIVLQTFDGNHDFVVLKEKLKEKFKQF